ncbi:MAG TPA: hypothetical protein VM840_02655 [Actinomycetota bacterium]|nr:hypothetical protein [Actinomycetota bacterium]
MALLKRLLYLQALLWAVVGLALAVVPAFVMSTLLGQPPYVEYAWIRVVGVQAFVLSLFMVMVGHRVEQLWWWTWAFALLAAGLGTIAILNAAFDLPPGAAAWPWWIFAALTWALALAMAWGLARAGQENPIV